ncbi:type IV secretory system conjugative DNA transfer family protein, partial [Flavonifractor sp. An4]|uniref:type IV secretory system conjugative DNA transfer family protein n=1 Tax=Flavonifractor sp. An4 TaxID=1965634 RepID=UPI000B37D38C
LCKKTGRALRKNGYQVIEINFQDCAASSYGYNPLMYVRRDQKRRCCHEQDILQIAAALSPVKTKNDPFWEQAAQMALSAMISYVLEYLPRQEHHLGSVIRLLREMGNGSFDRLFEEVCTFAPDSFAAAQYQMLRNIQKSPRTYASIQAFLAEKLSPFAFHGAQKLFTNFSQIYFQSLGDRKTAVFLTISDTDRSMDALVTLFYTQALQNLCRHADQCPGGRLRIPVRLILDDFAAGAAGCIADFDQISSVIRSREISVSIILQSLAQLEAAYGHDKAVTILSNCDHLLYLGGQELATARYISVKANKSVHTILNMPLNHAWLFTRGGAPKEVEKYRLEDHPLYHLAQPSKQKAACREQDEH